MPKILRCKLGTMSDIPSECVWGLKIEKNWQKTLAAWPETPVAVFEGRRVDVASHPNPNPKATPLPERWTQGVKAGLALSTAGSFMQLVCKKDLNIFLWLELQSEKQKGLVT